MRVTARLIFVIFIGVSLSIQSVSALSSFGTSPAADFLASVLGVLSAPTSFLDALAGEASTTFFPAARSAAAVAVLPYHPSGQRLSAAAAAVATSNPSSPLPTTSFVSTPPAAAGSSSGARPDNVQHLTAIDPPTTAFVTQDQFTAGLSALGNSLRQFVFQTESAPGSLPASGGYTNTIALTNKIDQLTNTSITNATVHGLNGLTDADIPDNITTSNYLPLAGGTLSGAITIPYLNATSTSATSTFSGNLAVIGTASTSNLIASNSFSIGSLSGFLKATAGAVSTSLVNLASDVTGILPVANGGTGWNSLAAGYIPFGNGSSGLATSSNLSWDNTNSRFGISTTTPWANLSVVGIAGQASTSPLFAISSSTSLVGGAYVSVSGIGASSFAGTAIDPQFVTEVLGPIPNTSINFPVGVFVQGNYAYVANNTGASLDIIDISNPTNPTYISQIQDSTKLAGAYGVFVSGKYAYVTTLTRKSLAVIDISNPSSPQFVGEYTSSTILGQARVVYVSGNYAYVTGSQKNALFTFDISNPYNPTLISSITTDLSAPRGLYISGKYAYVASVNNNSLVIFDVSNPSAPLFVSQLQDNTLLQSAVDVQVVGRYVYIVTGGSRNSPGTGRNSLAIVDVSNPASPTFVSEVHDDTRLSGARMVFVSGDYAYVTNNNRDSLAVINIADPNHPYFVAEQRGPVTGPETDASNGAAHSLGSALGLFVSGNYAYVTTDSHNSLAIIDVSGLKASNGQIGTAKIGNLSVDNYAQFSNGIYARGGLNVGGNALITGALSITGTSSPTLFEIASTTLSSGTSTPILVVTSTGRLGIGTSSPTTALQIAGSITPNADNTFTDGNATYRWSAVYSANGTIQTSDARLKSNVADVSYGLSDLLKLRPVSFTWTAQPQQGTQLGFIAQDVQPVFPEIVNVGDDSNHTLGLTYTEFIPIIVKAIQQVASISGTFKQNLVAWLGNASNGIGDLFANNLHAQNELCVGSTCVTPAQFQAMAAAANQSSGPGNAGSAEDGSSSAAPDATPPTIQINGGNPAVIQVGDTYADLGATITGPQADLNLGIKTFLNGQLTSNIVLDTSAAATDTIDYVATDQSGLTSTSTRIVIIASAAQVDTAASTTPQ